MAFHLVAKSRLIRTKLLNMGMIACSAMRHAHWNRDWKPGPYPRTPEERAAAAKKYGLLPEDYEPYPEEDCFGDYPNLPPVSAEARDPFAIWDHDAHKRNFGEPIHIDADMYGEDRFNINYRPRISTSMKILTLLGVISGSAGLFYLGEVFKFYPSIMPKQLYGEGVKHYTFEPET
uniref:NADH dehydrogenase (Ubiquinone) 1 beta subcomplex subunit 8, mitochondrial-like n=1 Tax=Scolopendra viridis TaxID=118503 RepID=A0A4D5RB40_SCOVI